jgi:WD40 repeat protein
MYVQYYSAYINIFIYLYMYIDIHIYIYLNTYIGGSSSSSKNKKVTNITIVNDSVLTNEHKNENLMDIDGAEEGEMIRNEVEEQAGDNVVGVATKGEVVIKQSIIDLHGHRSDVRGVCLSSDGLQLATCSSDGVKVHTNIYIKYIYKYIYIYT